MRKYKPQPYHLRRPEAFKRFLKQMGLQDNKESRSLANKLFQVKLEKELTGLAQRAIYVEGDLRRWYLQSAGGLLPLEFIAEATSGFGTTGIYVDSLADLCGLPEEVIMNTNCRIGPVAMRQIREFAQKHGVDPWAHELGE